MTSSGAYAPPSPEGKAFGGHGREEHMIRALMEMMRSRRRIRRYIRQIEALGYRRDGMRQRMWRQI